MTRMVRFSNNAVSKLAANITSTSTTITLQTGDGAKFPTLTGTQYFMATLVKADGTTEVVKVTARASDTLTVVRAAEAVASVQTAYAFSTGDRIEHRLTAGVVASELDRLDQAAYINPLNKSANYTVTANDVTSLIRVNTGSGNVTITLPDIATLTEDFDVIVAKVTGDTNVVTVARSGTDTINGATSYSLTNQWQAAWLTADRSTSTWTVISSGSNGVKANVDAFTGAGTAGPFTLSGDPGVKENTAVYVGGVYQQKSTYTLVGTSLTLGGTVSAGVPIEVIWSQPLQVGITSANQTMASDGAGGSLFTTVQGFITRLMSSVGSELMGFIQSGTGAVQRTAQDKMRETVSFKDFGAVGNAITNDTLAIQAALNSGAKNIVLDSAGTYLVSAALTVPAGVFIQGNNATIISATHFKILNFTNGGGVSDLNITGPGGASYVAGSTAISCSGTNNAPSAPTYVAGPTIENCTITGFGEYGIFLQYVKIAKINHNKITSVGYAGVGGVSCEDVIIDGNSIKNITPGSAGGDAYGIFIDRNNGNSETAEPRSYRCVITNNQIENVSADAADNGQGIDTHAGVDFIIDGNKITNCEAGIFLTASVISGAQALGPIRCVVSNNIITGSLNKSYGIILYGARSGASVAEHATDCVVSGNILVGHGWTTSGTVPGVFLSATKNATVTGNIFKQCGGSCLMLDFQNINFHISGNEFIDPQATSYTTPSCVLIYSFDNRGYLGGNTYRFENAALATYVAVNAVRIEASLTGLDLDFGKSTFQGIDASHLAFTALTTAGVRYAGFDRANGASSIAVSSGGGDGITDVVFPKRFPYAPKVSVSLRYPFNQGGKFPILGVDSGVAITANGFRIYAKPADGTTWSTTGSLSFDWSAE